MEWASGGDLGALISRRKRSGRRFTEPEILRLFYQTCSALAYCHHELKLLHRDLKPANIFIDSKGDVKVGDFGISRFLTTSAALAQTQCGTPLYMSPGPHEKTNSLKLKKASSTCPLLIDALTGICLSPSSLPCMQRWHAGNPTLAPRMPGRWDAFCTR